MEDTKRIRLVFKDDDILSQSQLSEGLNRSWILLKTHQHGTVSDLANHILHAFQLQRSCPHGILLSISGFVLPPFESTCILKDNEIIRVKKKRNVLTIEENNANAVNEVERLESVTQQPVNGGVLLLANEEFEKEKGGYDSDDPDEESKEEDEVDELREMEGPSSGNADARNRKRKAPEKLQGSKKKKQRADPPRDAADDAGVMKKKLPSNKEKEKETDTSSDDNVENNEENATQSDKNDVSVPGVQRKAEVQESKEAENAKNAAKETKKVPSRSARRKYAKRKWLREMAKIQKQACESEGLKNWKEDHAKAEKDKPVQPKRPQNWKKQRAPRAEKMDEDGQPKGLLHWKQSPQSNSIFKGKKHQKKNQDAYFHEHLNQKGDLAEATSSTKTISKEAEALVEEAIQEQKDRLRLKENQNQNGDVGEQRTQKGDGHEQSNQKALQEEQPDERNGVHEQPNQQKGDSQEQPHPNGDASAKSNQGDDEEGVVVPIVIRPGHIRFEPLDKEEAVQRDRVPSDNFQWNGVTSKKKGQKWGMEKSSFIPRNDYKNSNKEQSEIPINEKEREPVEKMDFDKLPLLTATPEEGELIAYRVLELSSCWTPELSPFRVGKVSWYNAKSNQVMVKPVPEYPIVSKADEDEDKLPDDSLYKEDGSLKIDFSALIDVRIFNPRSLEQNGVSSQLSEGPIGKENTPSSNGKQTSDPNPENNGMDLWDQISETLNAKKEELTKESSWGKPPKKPQVSQGNSWDQNANNGQKIQENSCGRQSSGGKSWAYKALRGSALGPTMAMLRSKKHT